MTIHMQFWFDPELPKGWALSFDELEPYLKELPRDKKFTRGEMLSAYRDGIPTKDLTFRDSDEYVWSTISGDKDRLIWAKWRLAVAQAIAGKYGVTLCGVKFDGRNFELSDLFKVLPYIPYRGDD